MGQTANDAATKVKTFSQLFDTLKEAAQSGWTQSWEIIVGNFDEAKELLTEMSNTFSAIINSSADARNSMLQGWKDLGGRTALIEAARNAFEGVLSIIKPVKEAFREIFPPMTAQQLYNITDALKNLTAHLKLSDTNSENLKRTFKGLFAVIDIVKQAFVAVAKGVGSLLGGTGDLAGSILSVTARFGDWLVKLDETIKKTDIFNIAIQTVIKCIKTGVAVATDLIDKAVDAVTRFANAIKQKYDTGGFAVIHSVLERVHARMSEVGEAADGMRSGVEIAIGAMGKALENSKFLQVLQALWDGVKTIGTGIAKAMKTLASGFVEDISDINFSSVFDVLSGISLAGIAVGINKFLKGITDAVSDVTKLTDQIKGILDSVRGCFEAYQTQLKAGTLIKIASAIAILTGAIVVLSLIDSAKLASAITALTGLFAELMASMAIFTKISGDLKKATKTVTIMLGLSVSVLILASALKKIASLSWNEIAKGLTGITVISGVLAGVAKVISKDEKTIAKGAFNLIFLATAVKILASACKDISQLSWGELGKGLTGVGVLMAEIALFLNTAKFSGKAVSTATGILVLSAAIKVLASACKDFGSMQWSEIGILLAEIATFTNLTGNAKHVISTGIALIAIAGAMKIMASAVEDFGSMQWDEIGRGLTVMAGALAEITLAVNLMPKNMVSTGVGLIAVAGALTILSNVLSTMGNFTWEEIGKGLVTMGGALAELSIALNLMNGTLAGSAALLIASASLAVLAPVLSILGAMSWEAIAKGLVSLAGAFAIIGVAGAVLSPIIPSILALAGAFTLIGVGVAATGAGLLAAGLGLQALAIGFTAVAAAGTAGATALVAALAVIITGVADLIPAVLVKLAEGIAQFCVALAGAAPQILESLVIIITACLTAISNVVPQLVEVLVTLLVTTLQTLAEHTPEIVQAVFDILIACLQGIADNIGMVVQTAIDIVLNFIDGIAQKLPDVIQSGVNLLLSFIEGITSAIDNNSARLANDIRNLFLALLRAAVLVLTGGIVDIKAVGSKIMNSGLIQGIKDKLSHLKETVRDLISNAKQVIEDKIDSFKSIGKHLISGFIGGIKDKASDLANSALSAVKGAVNGVKSFLGIHSPSKLFAQFGRYTDEGFINGVKAYAGKVSDATVDMGKGAVGAMSDTLSTIADLVDSDIDSEPTIRPVMDLSNIQNGANQLFSMMKSVDGYSLSGSLDIANRTGSRINEVRSKTTDNSSVLDKISDAVGNFNGGNSFENTFNITGSNPKEIAEEVSNIIQRQVERRDASWA